MADLRRPRRPRGRPREARVDDAIVNTAQRLLASGAFLWLSMDRIAEEAGVTKPAIYRRFASKTELAMAAIDAVRTGAPPPVVTGDLRADLLWQLHNLQEVSTRYGGMLMTGTVLAEEHHQPELLQHFREGVVRLRRQRVRALLTSALARGTIRADADLDTVVNLLIGYWYATYIDASTIPADWAERGVQLLLDYLHWQPD